MHRSTFVAAGFVACALASPVSGQVPFCADPADPSRPAKAARLVWERPSPLQWKSTAIDHIKGLVVTSEGEIAAVATLMRPDGEAKRANPVPVLLRWNRDGREVGDALRLDVGDRSNIPVTGFASLGVAGFVVSVGNEGEAEWLIRFDAAGKTLWRWQVEPGGEGVRINGLHALPDGGVFVTVQARTRQDRPRVMRLAPDGRLRWTAELRVEARTVHVERDRMRVFLVGAGAAVVQEFTDEPAGGFKLVNRLLAQPTDDRTLYWPLATRDGRVFVSGVMPSAPLTPPPPSIARDARMPAPPNPPPVAILLRFDASLEAADLLTATGVGTGFHFALELPDRGVVAVGSEEGTDAYHYCFVRFDADGRETWRRHHAMFPAGEPRSFAALPASLHVLADGTMLLLGRAIPSTSAALDYWLVRLRFD